MTSDILFETRGAAGLLTLARPQSLNALNLPMIDALQNHLQVCEADSRIQAVVIQASPGKAFCAGGDVRWLYEMGLAKNPLQMQFFQHEYRLNQFIHQLTKPYIALMDGINMGGGVGISLHGSHPVATERFVFAMPETGIGLFPDIGASYLLSRTPGALGLYLALTGSRLGADDALRFGLVKHVIDSRALPDMIVELARLDLSGHAHERVSAWLARRAAGPGKGSGTVDPEKINFFFQAETLKALIAGLDSSDDPWARETLANLRQKSPTSLEVTFEQIRRAQSLSLEECLEVDYCLVGHFMQDRDFYEGIRAVLIDKDKTPHWQPDSLDGVMPARVAHYFECTRSGL